MEEIRSWWEVASIAHFCTLFRDPFKLASDFDVDELEEALVSCCHDNVNPLISGLLVELLKGCFPRKDVTEETYMEYLQRAVVRCNRAAPPGGEMTEPLGEADTDFGALSLRRRIQLLHLVCECRVCASDVCDKIKDVEGDELRVDPVGQDASGATYWYFNDTRLYKEDVEVESKVKKTKKRRSTKRRRSSVRKRSCVNGVVAAATRGLDNGALSDDGGCHDNDATLTSLRRSGRNRSTGHVEVKNSRTSDVSVDESPPSATRWHLVCETLDQWRHLADTFSESGDSCEQKLGTTIANELLPELPTVFENKERRLRRKLLEFVPRRISTRLQGRRRGGGDPDEDAVLPPMSSIVMTEEMTTQRREEVVREGRTRAKEDRTRRAELREMRLLMSGELPDEFKVTNTPQRKNEKELLCKAMTKVLGLVYSRREAWPFQQPVDESYAPRYYDIIKTPMDLSAIDEKIKAGSYAGRDELLSDAHLIFDNCLQYNGFASEFTNLAQKLLAFFERCMDKYIPIAKAATAIDDTKVNLHSLGGSTHAESAGASLPEGVSNGPPPPHTSTVINVTSPPAASAAPPGGRPENQLHVDRSNVWKQSIKRSQLCRPASGSSGGHKVAVVSPPDGTTWPPHSKTSLALSLHSGHQVAPVVAHSGSATRPLACTVLPPSGSLSAGSFGAVTQHKTDSICNGVLRVSSGVTSDNVTLVVGSSPPSHDHGAPRVTAQVTARVTAQVTPQTVRMLPPGGLRIPTAPSPGCHDDARTASAPRSPLRLRIGFSLTRSPGVVTSPVTLTTGGRPAARLVGGAGHGTWSVSGLGLGATGSGGCARLNQERNADGTATMNAASSHRTQAQMSGEDDHS